MLGQSRFPSWYDHLIQTWTTKLFPGLANKRNNVSTNEKESVDVPTSNDIADQMASLLSQMRLANQSDQVTVSRPNTSTVDQDSDLSEVDEEVLFPSHPGTIDQEQPVPLPSLPPPRPRPRPVMVSAQPTTSGVPGSSLNQPPAETANHENTSREPINHPSLSNSSLEAPVEGRTRRTKGQVTKVTQVEPRSTRRSSRATTGKGRS